MTSMKTMLLALLADTLHVRVRGRVLASGRRTCARCWYSFLDCLAGPSHAARILRRAGRLRPRRSLRHPFANHRLRQSFFGWSALCKPNLPRAGSEARWSEYGPRWTVADTHGFCVTRRYRCDRVRGNSFACRERRILRRRTAGANAVVGPRGMGIHKCLTASGMRVGGR